MTTKGAIYRSDDDIIPLNSKTAISPIGGYLVRLTNKTGGNTVKGYVIHPSITTDDAFELVPDDDPDPCGIIYEGGIADGEECWVVTRGFAEIYFESAVTRGKFVRSKVAADGGLTGVAVAEALPAPPFSSDKHFQEVGHAFQSIGGAGLARCLLHFN
jgi:hypothetical protein